MFSAIWFKKSDKYLVWWHELLYLFDWNVGSHHTQEICRSLLETKLII